MLLIKPEIHSLHNFHPNISVFCFVEVLEFFFFFPASAIKINIFSIVCDTENMNSILMGEIKQTSVWLQNSKSRTCSLRRSLQILNPTSSIKTRAAPSLPVFRVKIRHFRSSLNTFHSPLSTIHKTHQVSKPEKTIIKKKNTPHDLLYSLNAAPVSQPPTFLITFHLPPLTPPPPPSSRLSSQRSAFFLLRENLNLL